MHGKENIRKRKDSSEIAEAVWTFADSALEILSEPEAVPLLLLGAVAIVVLLFCAVRYFMGTA